MVTWNGIDSGSWSVSNEGKTCTLTGDVTITTGQTLTIPSENELIIPKGKALHIDFGGELINNGKITNNGAIDNFGTTKGEEPFGNGSVYNEWSKQFTSAQVASYASNAATKLSATTIANAAGALAATAPASAASILNQMDKEKAASILAAMVPAKAANILISKMDDDYIISHSSAGSILTENSITATKAADILAAMTHPSAENTLGVRGSGRAASILSSISDPNAAKLVAAMVPTNVAAAAKILNESDENGITSILTNMEAAGFLVAKENDNRIISDANVAKILAAMEASSTSEAPRVVALMVTSAAAGILSAMAPTTASDILGDIVLLDAGMKGGRDQAAAIMGAMAPASAAAILADRGFSTATAAAILAASSISTAKAAAILADSKMPANKAAAILAENSITATKAAAILVAKNEKGDAIISDSSIAEILADSEMLASKAAAILAENSITATKAAAILTAMNADGSAIIKTAKAASILAAMVPAKAAAILGAMAHASAASAAKILADSNMTDTNAAKIIAVMAASSVTTQDAARILADSNIPASKAAAILVARDEIGDVIISDYRSAGILAQSSLPVAKAAEILAAMVPANTAKAAGILVAMTGSSPGLRKTADILADSKMPANKAASILAAMVPANTAKAVAILGAMTGTDPGKQTAAAILAAMHTSTAATTIMNAMAATEAASILKAMETTQRTAATTILNDMAANAKIAVKTQLRAIGSALGDPYISPVYGPRYKLPDRNGVYRYISNKAPYANRFSIDADVVMLTKKQQFEALRFMIENDRESTQALSVKLTLDGYFFRNYMLTNCGEKLLIDMEADTINGKPLKDIKTDKFTVSVGKEQAPPAYPYTEEQETVYSLTIETYHETYGNIEVVLYKYVNPQIRNGISMRTEKELTHDNSKGFIMHFQHYKQFSVRKLGSKKDIANFDKTKVPRKRKEVTEEFVYPERGTKNLRFLQQ